MHHTDFDAHQALTPRATAGANWTRPAPMRAPRRAGLLAVLLAALGLAACGGGSGADDVAPDRSCNPDTFDCVAMYGADYPYAFEHVDASVQVFSFDPAPRAGFVRIK